MDFDASNNLLEVPASCKDNGSVVGDPMPLMKHVCSKTKTMSSQKDTTEIHDQMKKKFHYGNTFSIVRKCS